MLAPTKPPTSRFAFVKRWWFIAVAVFALVAIAVVAIAAFRSNLDELLPPAQDDFGELFSSPDVFQPEWGCK